MVVACCLVGVFSWFLVVLAWLFEVLEGLSGVFPGFFRGFEGVTSVVAPSGVAYEGRDAGDDHHESNH